eukprot:scaffold3779_cov149-Skeletonema_marinoi.AAC.2
MNNLSYLAILLASAAVGTQGKYLCSCSPTIFNFVLDFSNDDCTVDTITEVVDAVPGQPASDEAISTSKLDDSEMTNMIKMNYVVFKPQTKLLSTDGVATVIHSDNTYITTSLLDGEAMQFYSVSSMLNSSVPLADQTENPALVPAGASLILYGKTESGKVIRYRFFWLYEMTNCGRDNKPVQVGDQIGWEPGELGGAWPAFCPARQTASPTISPTISPRTKDPAHNPSSAPIDQIPTVTPSAKPVTTDAPSTGPSAKPIPDPSPREKPTRSNPKPTQSVFGSKSTKSKSLKPPHSSKSSKSKSAKKSN